MDERGIIVLSLNLEVQLSVKGTWTNMITIITIRDGETHKEAVLISVWWLEKYTVWNVKSRIFFLFLSSLFYCVFPHHGIVCCHLHWFIRHQRLWDWNYSFSTLKTEGRSQKMLKMQCNLHLKDWLHLSRIQGWWSGSSSYFW